MELRIIGCHGGESPQHRTSAFLLDERLAIDAGSLTRGLDLSLQLGLEACVVSHAHLDHVRDLATIADNRCQAGSKTLKIGALRETITALKQHFFNDVLWPDFTKIPAGDGPTLEFVELTPETPTRLAGYEVQAIHVSHSIDTAGFVVRGQGACLAYSGDTGPTERFWEVLNAQPDLSALLLEVSFPNAEQRLATLSGHHTPQTATDDLRKLTRARDIPTLIYHMKPVFLAEIERECARVRDLELTVTKLDEVFVL